MTAKPCELETCRKFFKPAHTWTRFCSKSCAGKARNHPALQAAAKQVAELRSKAATLRWRASILERFGVLSDREEQIANVMYQRGYDRGYQSGVSPLRRRSPQSASAR